MYKSKRKNKRYSCTLKNGGNKSIAKIFIHILKETVLVLNHSYNLKKKEKELRDKVNNQESILETEKNIMSMKKKLFDIDKQIKDLQSDNKPIPLSLKIYKNLIKKLISFREKSITEIENKLFNIEKDLKNIIHIDKEIPLGNRIYKGFISFIEKKPFVTTMLTFITPIIIYNISKLLLGNRVRKMEHKNKLVLLKKYYKKYS